MIDLLIKGGIVVLPDLCLEMDVAILGNQIVALEQHLGKRPARRTINAQGCYLLPGGVDPHVHVQWPFLDSTTADDFAGATIAAAIGGTTTIIDFAHPAMGSSPLERIATRQKQAEGQAVIDYGLHCVMTNTDTQHLHELKELIALGITSFKTYLTYSRRGIMVDDATLVKFLQRIASLHATLCVHAENGIIADANEAEFIAEGKTSPEYFPIHKPALVEAEAVARMLFFAKYTGARVYFHHLSTEMGVELVRSAQRNGAEVFAETCPHYLLLDAQLYNRPLDGHRYICSPPLRSEGDKEALWGGVADNVISAVGTDHCAFVKAQKDKSPEDFTKVPNGLPGVETRIPLLFSEGVAKGRISLDTFVRATSSGPARIFGLYPQKGMIAPGSDADLVVFDPGIQWTLSAEHLHMASDWSPFERWAGVGAPVMTISRGKVIVENSEFVGQPGWGQFLRRNISK